MVSNRNANEAANILTLLQGKDNIDAVKRSVLRLNEILSKMKKIILQKLW